MRFFFILVLSTVFLSIFTLQLFSQNTETLTITTYYPSPSGVYQNLRLFPVAAAQAPACNANQEGTMYYNNDAGQNQLMVCRETALGVFGWRTVGGGPWTQVGNNIYPNDTATANVGIGTTTPVARLQVVGEIVGNSTVNILNSGLAGDGSQTVLRKDAAQAHIWPWGTGTTLNTVCVGCGTSTNFSVNGTTTTVGFVIQRGTPSSPQEGQIWLQ